ncbi:Uncharacterized membrane protein YhaH, DUF805 family [Pseudooceanicola antarcticus]|uniref:Uncharacterized membrane protein YhaH, DUF805 family n=1 Tax=Pseudooceanicola antarcticus TaxID=1247613 RepID=A0A285IYC9_9RHOB|nr:DUF805 domain-containing protein [Pseudooceanicola antarcticus]SNY52096.1 Uncharacterized membrane protein YhaH, DUF805 family [Pseudooceanicola antarcticus]
MTLIEAVKVCLRKYFVFSGRASRAEFWKFVVGIFLASIVASVANVVFFGPLIETKFVVQMTAEGASEGFVENRKYGSGPLSNLLSIAVLVPFLAVANRRLHDIGRPGWHLVVAWAMAFALLVFTLFAFRVEVPISEAAQAAMPSVGASMLVPQPPANLFLASWVVSLGVLVLSILWLARRGAAEDNQFGPAPQV